MHLGFLLGLLGIMFTLSPAFLRSHGRTALKMRPMKYVCMSSAGASSEWPVEKVRSKFVDYFVNKREHVNYKSSPVVPVNDPTLLFANAGMNQYKPIFVGTVDPSSPLASLTRAVNSQKCIRAGGKHNDLDDVGKDTYHHTFFEMLGTWSFGNYFKQEAIDWAWDLLVNEYGLPADQLYASYFGGDDALGLPADEEARRMWLQYLPAEKILPFDKSDNFWEMGDTGPCGPCSEIHFDRIGGRDASGLVNMDDPDVIEIWNLVFMQYNREEGGTLKTLPAKHIDTGMGLERLTSILQQVNSNYDTDVFTPLFTAIESTVGCPAYSGRLGGDDASIGFRDTAYRVVADHIRTLCFAIADGAVPSNEGRGYVLRRVLRRAIRYGMQTLGAEAGFLAKLVPTLVSTMGDAFPELTTKQAMIIDVIEEEEVAFSALLDRGIKYLNGVVEEAKARGDTQLSGETAFYLYDTLGFPLDLTEIMADELGVGVDAHGFAVAMHEQKERSREATKARRLAGRRGISLGVDETALLKDRQVSATIDERKYTWDEDVSTSVVAVFDGASFRETLSGETFFAAVDATVGVVLAETSFYAESGGQIADTGTLKINGAMFDVIDVQTYGGYVLHVCVPSEGVQVAGDIAVGSPVTASVDYARRRKVAPNHTMTHVLNHALRQVLGGDVDQKGSLVADDKFRFDFSCNRAVKTKELRRVEGLVEEVISRQLPVSAQLVPLKDAQEIYGLRAVFGEAYPDPVRVISVGADMGEVLENSANEAWGGVSIEFCGGTHVSNTAEAEGFVITEETAVAKGIRRVAGVTGTLAKEAKLRASGLEAETHEAVGRVQAVVTSPEVPSATQVDSVERTIVALKASLDDLVLAQAVKSELRSKLDQGQKDLAGTRNRILIAAVDAGISTAKKEAKAAKASGKNIAVLQVDIGADAKGVKRAIDEISKAAPEVAFLGLSRCDVQDKLLCFSFVPEGHPGFTNGGELRANDWLMSTLDACGGRGGGKPNMAQGSAAGAGQLSVAVEAARKFVNV